MLRVIMHGCNGSMGQIISELIEKEEDMEIVAGIDIKGKNTDSYPVFKKMAECHMEADVVIDFSNVSAIDELIEACVYKQYPVVVCTTGLTQRQEELIQKASKEIPILRSANMSLGIQLLTEIVKDTAGRLYQSGYDIEIVERHHNQKEDAPSGTALALADSINKSLNGECEYVYDRSGRKQKRKKEEIGISSVRGGTITGQHEVIFAGEDEVIEIHHTAYSKAIFGRGAIEAAKFLAVKKAGFYNISDVIQR